MSQWLKLLEDLVCISSETAMVGSVQRVQDIFEKELIQLGLKTRQIKNPSEKSAKLVLGEIQGRSSQYITLVCHADTVFNKDHFRPELKVLGNKAYGPGVVDNKGGMIVILNGLKKLFQGNPSINFGIRVISSPNEELGSIGFHDLFKKLSLDSPIILGFEPAYKDGDIITGRKGNRWYNIKVKGKKAHSGREHHLGVNACGELALQLAKLQSLTDYSKDLTVNIGKINGGIRHNIVSDYAFGQLEVRYPCFVTQSFITQKIEEQLSYSHIKCAQAKTESEIDFEIIDDCPPLASNEKSLNLFKKYQKIVHKIEDKNISPQMVGGAADVNHFSGPEKIILDGLGPIGGNMHTTKEYLVTESLETRARALKEILITLDREDY